MNKEEILEKLKNVNYPGFSKDIVSYGFVKDAGTRDNKIFVILEITSSAKEIAEQLKKDIKNAIGEDTEVTINAPKEPVETSSRDKNIAPSVKSFLMVSSGKGGVGKSTTTVNLAIALAMQGKKVGILDADIYGPNIPRMMGIENQKPSITSDNKITPFDVMGVKVVSMGNLMNEAQAVIWRGAMIMRAIQQLLQDVKWGELDILVIDMPPGTGDAQLTLAQNVPVTGGIVVTTPQMVSLDDSKRSLDMFEKLKIPLAGIVENMSGFVCPSCNTKSDIFDSGTTEDIAKEFNTKVLAKIPIEPAIREGGDNGKPVVYFQPESHTSKSYMRCADDIWESMADMRERASNASIQPTNPSSAPQKRFTATPNG